MITANDLLFSPNGAKDSIPQWGVSIGGKEIALVVERLIVIPKYRVNISNLDEDKFFDERKEVVEYILTNFNQ